MPAENGGLEEFYCKQEYKGHLIYSFLAERERNPERKKILSKLSEDEYEHYLFWKKRLGGRECAVKLASIYLLAVLIARTFLGLTFTLKILEKGEMDAVKAYSDYLSRLEGEERKKLENIIKDEELHERELIGQVNEAIVKYMSFIVLGLADAIVEITGVHAGFLGVTSNTIVAGIAGLVVGFSAAISMASAAYLQAGHEAGKNPLSSALFTGASYIFTVALLAAPYFITHSMLIAFTVSVSIAIIMITVFTFYGSIVFDKAFTIEFIKTTSLMLGTAFAAYWFGDVLGSHFGLRGIIG